jgi:DNA-binding CsgD family transcriptional regulator
LPTAERRAIEAYDLTRREAEILGYAARGLSDRQIAEALFISPNTVKTHIRSILRKTGSASRREFPFAPSDSDAPD